MSGYCIEDASSLCYMQQQLHASCAGAARAALRTGRQTIDTARTPLDPRSRRRAAGSSRIRDPSAHLAARPDAYAGRLRTVAGDPWITNREDDIIHGNASVAATAILRPPPGGQPYRPAPVSSGFRSPARTLIQCTSATTARSSFARASIRLRYQLNDVADLRLARRRCAFEHHGALQATVTAARPVYADIDHAYDRCAGDVR